MSKIQADSIVNAADDGGAPDFPNSIKLGGTELEFGTYTPTIGNGSLATGSSTGTNFNYYRIGNIVQVCGIANVENSGAGIVKFVISLPIASDLSTTVPLTGSAGLDNGNFVQGEIFADRSGNNAEVWVDVNTFSTFSYDIAFTYVVG